MKKYKFFSENINDKNKNSLSSMLGRDVSPQKDPNNYNFDLVSKTRDKIAGMLMETGIETILNKDVITITGLSRNYLYDKMDLYDINLAENIGDYRLYNYNLVIENELRTKFLLQTESKDDFPEMYKELKEKLEKYLNKSELEKLDIAVKNGSKRLHEEVKLSFLDPYQGLEEGNLRDLTKEEIKSNNFIKGLEEYPKVDDRSDNHDLLSLKELLLVLDGKDVEEYSIALGFFAKIMPELIKEDIHSVLIKTKNKKIIDLKFAKFVSNKSMYYSPLKAGISLVENFLVTKNIETYRIGNRDVTSTKFSNYQEILEDEQFFVVVDGNIAIPSNEETLGYSENCINTIEKKCAELFLFKKDKSIRIGFTPYNYNNIPLIHQHGSVIFGSNDQTYHSVSERTSEEISQTMISKVQDLWNKNNKRFNLNEGNSPATIAIMYKNKDEDPINFFKERKNVENLIKSLNEESFSTLDIEMNSTFELNNIYNKEEFKSMVYSLIINLHPLSKCFNLKKYIEENSLDKLQLTNYYELAMTKYEQDNYSVFDTLSDNDEE